MLGASATWRLRGLNFGDSVSRRLSASVVRRLSGAAGQRPSGSTACSARSVNAIRSYFSAQVPVQVGVYSPLCYYVRLERCVVWL